MDHKIIFDVSQFQNKKTSPFSAEEKAQKVQAEKEKKEKEKKDKLVAAAVGMVVKRVGSEAASMVGELTGDYFAQNQIDNVSTIVGFSTAIMINPVLGGTALALTVGTSAYKEAVSRAKQRYTIQYMQDLTGTTLTPLENKFGKGV